MLSALLSALLSANVVGTAIGTVVGVAIGTVVGAAICTVIGTGTVKGEGFGCAMICSRPLSSVSLSEQVVSRRSTHPVAKPSKHKETQMVGQLAPLQLHIIPSQLIPSWRLLVIQLTALLSAL